MLLKKDIKIKNDVLKRLGRFKSYNLIGVYSSTYIVEISGTVWAIDKSIYLELLNQKCKTTKL